MQVGTCKIGRLATRSAQRRSIAVGAVFCQDAVGDFAVAADEAGERIAHKGKEQLAVHGFGVATVVVVTVAAHLSRSLQGAPEEVVARLPYILVGKGFLPVFI